MRLVQPLRKGCTGVNPKSLDAFDLSANNLVKYTDYGHWYVFTTGFREMAQFNIGMYGNYLRVGIGFDISRTVKHASPNVGHNVANSFNKFKEFVLNNKSSFISAVYKILTQVSTYCPGSSFGVEYGASLLSTNKYPITDLIDFIQQIAPKQIHNNYVFTHPNNGNSDWFFVGALLKPNDYIWPCSQNCSQATSGLGGSQIAINLLDIVKLVFTELFPYLGNSL
ncbi:MAG: hypothetical protein L5655_10910 [Thermosediminibacteraceae bacterium]|nr:hypothetical protein [Thermosediminibacteraceae bacterium]